MAVDMGRHAASDQPTVDGASFEERETFRLLYEEYATRVRSFCARRLGNRADVEDAVQDTFLKAYRGLPRFHTGAPVWPWLATIAAHVCTDVHRARGGEIDDALVPIASTVAEPDEEAARRAKVTIVDDALRSLPPRYRASLFMRHFEGLSHEEIARVQGVSIASVKSVLMRGRRQLGARVEALARIERQWPLPSTVSMVVRRVRERVRVWQRDLDRLVQGAVTVVDSAVSLGRLFSHAPAAMVAVAALTAVPGVDVGSSLRNVVPVPLAVGPVTITDDPAAPQPLLVVDGGGRGVSVGAPPHHDDVTKPFFSVDPTKASPIVPTGPLPPGGIEAHDYEDGPVGLSVHPIGFYTWSDCKSSEADAKFCEVVRTVLPVVREHDPGTSDAGVVDVEDGQSSR